MSRLSIMAAVLAALVFAGSASAQNVATIKGDDFVLHQFTKNLKGKQVSVIKDNGTMLGNYRIAWAKVKCGITDNKITLKLKSMHSKHMMVVTKEIDGKTEDYFCDDASGIDININV